MFISTCQVCAMDSKAADTATASPQNSSIEAIVTNESEIKIDRGATASKAAGYPSSSSQAGPGQRPFGEDAPVPSWDDADDYRNIDRNVYVHIYHIDSATAWLNWAWLKNADIPIYHTGIEVYGEEWAFNYFDDCWDDPSISGIINCVPKEMPGYEYQDTVCLGPTTLSEDAVDRALLQLRDEWPACTYHLTRRNCISFAQTFVGVLRPPEPFPSSIGAVNEASKKNPIHEGVVDYGWGWAKWWMRRKFEQEQAELEAEAARERAAAEGQPATHH
jgi:hypothetical protein